MSDTCAIPGCNRHYTMRNKAIRLLEHCFTWHVDQSKNRAFACPHCDFWTKWPSSRMTIHIRNKHRGLSNIAIDNRSSFRSTLEGLVSQFYPHMIQECRSTMCRWPAQTISDSVSAEPKRNFLSAVVKLEKQDGNAMAATKSTPISQRAPVSTTTRPRRSTAASKRQYSPEKAVIPEKNAPQRRMPQQSQTAPGGRAKSGQKRAALKNVLCRRCEVSIVDDHCSRAEHYFHKHTTMQRFTCPYCSLCDRKTEKEVECHIDIKHYGKTKVCLDRADREKYQIEIRKLYEAEEQSTNSVKRIRQPAAPTSTPLVDQMIQRNAQTALHFPAANTDDDIVTVYDSRRPISQPFQFAFNANDMDVGRPTRQQQFPTLRNIFDMFGGYGMNMNNQSAQMQNPQPMSLPTMMNSMDGIMSMANLVNPDFVTQMQKQNMCVMMVPMMMPMEVARQLQQNQHKLMITQK